MKKKNSTCTSDFGGFFTEPDPDCSVSDPDFWPIRIRTQEKMSDPDPEKTRSRNTGKNEQVLRVYSIFHAGLALALSNKCFRVCTCVRQTKKSIGSP